LYPPLRVTVSEAVPIVAFFVSPFVTWTFPGLRSLWTLVAFPVSYVAAYFAATLMASSLSGTASVGASPWAGLVLVSVAAFAAFAILASRPTVPRSWATWLAPGAMIGIGLLTAFLSGPQGGPGRLMHFLLDVLKLSPESAQTVNFIVRKSAHLTVYGLLGLSAGAVAARQGADRRWTWVAGLSWVVVHATLDESHQTTTSVRTGAVSDVFLDSTGAVVFLGIQDFLRLKRGKEAAS